MIKNLIYRNLPADLIPVKAYRFITRNHFIAPFYHTVSNIPLPHIDQLYPVVTEEKFEKDIDFLLKHFRPVTLFEVIDHVKEDKPFDKPSFFLSFDDGLKEFHEVIAPVLIKKGVPATCFLNSAFIDNKNLFFRYKASLVVNRIKKDHTPEFWKGYHALMDKKKFPLHYKENILKIDYSSSFLLDELARLLHFSFDEYLKDEKPYLTTDQINHLIEKGFTFGAHSHTHPDFRDLSFEEQLEEAYSSIEKVHEKFNLSYKVFSFPFTDSGITNKFFLKLKERSSVDLTFGCAGIKNDSIPWNIQRIPIEEYSINANQRIKRDYFYFVIKSFLGKNKIQRK